MAKCSDCTTSAIERRWIVAAVEKGCKSLPPNRVSMEEAVHIVYVCMYVYINMTLGQHHQYQSCSKCSLSAGVCLWRNSRNTCVYDIYIYVYVCSCFYQPTVFCSHFCVEPFPRVLYMPTFYPNTPAEGVADIAQVYPHPDDIVWCIIYIAPSRVKVPLFEGEFCSTT